MFPFLSKDKLVSGVVIFLIFLLAIYALIRFVPLWAYTLHNKETIANLNSVNKEERYILYNYTNERTGKTYQLRKKLNRNEISKIENKSSLAINYSPIFPKVTFVKDLNERHLNTVILSLVAMFFIIGALYLYIQSFRGKISLAILVGLDKELH